MPGRLILLCPDETTRFLTTQRDELLDRLAGVSYETLAPPEVAPDDARDDGSFLYRGEMFDRNERRIPIADIVDPSDLEVFLAPAHAPVVVSRSGVRTGINGPWPEIEEAAHSKARRLLAESEAIVAFEGGYLRTSANIWAELVTAGRIPVAAQLPENVAGVLIFWQDARRTKPVKVVFVWNQRFSGSRERVDAVLAALG